MKLQLLLRSFEFDDLYPTIAVMYPNAKRHKAQFEHAYELLTSIPPVPSKKRIRYQVLEASWGNGSYFGAQDVCFNATWDVLAGKEVSRDKYVDLTDEELAANCLINAIFIGKHPEAFNDSYAKLVRG